MEVLKNLAKALWTNHRKKVVAFLLGLLFGAIATLTGIPVSEIKEAAQEASKPAVAQPAPTNQPANDAPEL